MSGAVDYDKLSEAALADVVKSGGNYDNMSEATLAEITGGGHAAAAPAAPVGNKFDPKGWNQKTNEAVGDGLLGAVNGVLAGAAPRIGAAGNALYDRLTGASPDLKSAYNNWYGKANQIYQDANKRSPIASTIGGIAGGVMSPATKLGPVGYGAVGGAMRSNDLSDIGQTAKTTAEGATTGAALGYLGNKLGNLGTTATNLENAGNTNVIKALNAVPNQLQKIEFDGPGIAQAGKAVRDAGVPIFGQTGKSLAKNILAKTREKGQNISKIYGDLDAKGAQGPLLQDVQEGLGEYADTLAKDPFNPQYAVKVHGVGENFGNQYNSDAAIPFTKFSKNVTQAQKAFNQGGMTPQPAREAQQGMSMRMREMLNKAGSDAGVENLPELNQEYSTLRMLQPAARRAATGSGQGLSISATQTAKNLFAAYGRSSLAAGQIGAAQAARTLGGMIEEGTPMGEVVKKAVSFGVPNEIIQQLQPGQGNP